MTRLIALAALITPAALAATATAATYEVTVTGTESFSATSSRIGETSCPIHDDGKMTYDAKFRSRTSEEVVLRPKDGKLAFEPKKLRVNVTTKSFKQTTYRRPPNARDTCGETQKGPAERCNKTTTRGAAFLLADQKVKHRPNKPDAYRLKEDWLSLRGGTLPSDKDCWRKISAFEENWPFRNYLPGASTSRAVLGDLLDLKKGAEQTIRGSRKALESGTMALSDGGTWHSAWNVKWEATFTRIK